MTTPANRIDVLFVCLGNICRSPTAEGVFRHMVREAALEDRIGIDSAGTGSWHVGDAPDRRATAHAKQRGIDLTGLRARKLMPGDFARFDYLLAMDDDNRRTLEATGDPEHVHKIRLFLSFAPDLGVEEVPDPYMGGADGFEHVLDLVEAGCRGLLADVRARLG